MLNNVLVIGAVNIDINTQTVKPYTMHDSNIINSTISIGGVGGNIAFNLARLGVHVSFLTILGNDSFAHTITKTFKELQIQYPESLILDTKSNLYISVLDHQGELFLGLNDMKSISYLTPTIIQSKHDYISQFNTIVIDNNLEAETIHHICKTYHDKFLIIDAVSCEKAPKLLPVLDYVNIVKMNKLEYDELFDGKAEAQNTLQNQITKGLQVLLTDHDQDIFVYTAHKTYQTTPIPCSNIVSTSGAGDGLLSGYIYGIVSGKTIEESLEIGKRIAYVTSQVPTSTSKEVKSNEFSN